MVFFWEAVAKGREKIPQRIRQIQQSLYCSVRPTIANDGFDICSCNAQEE